MGRVNGKVAFVTGAAIGQGRSHAVKLAEEGADIVALDLAAPYDVKGLPQYPSGTREDLKETWRLVRDTGRQCVALAADVRDRSHVQTVVDAGLEAFGHIDIVCANAGVITYHERSWEMPEQTYDLILDTNLKGVWNTIVTTVPAMIAAKRGGVFILTSGVAGIRGACSAAHYVASKHGVVGLMKAFANELAPYRIRVNTVHPTGVATAGMGTGSSEVALPIFSTHPLGMLGATNTLPDLETGFDNPYAPVGVVPEIDVSNAVLWLASDEARYVTGVQLPVDAGNTNKP